MRKNVGIFLCDCGKSLKNIDFEMVREKAGEFQDVAHVGLNSSLCLKEGLEEMVAAIKEKDVNRVVIAACSPEFKESLFRKALDEAGLNFNLLSIANIREQCSWAHGADVTEKAIEMTRMAANKVRLLNPIEQGDVEVTREALIVGGDLSGMRSALEISQLGLKATLVEREPTLPLEGLEKLYAFETNTLGWKDGRMEGWKDENIEVLTEASVVKVEGDVGNFSVRIRRGAGGEIRRKFGAIILATGQMTEISSADFKRTPNIISQRELVSMLQAPQKLSRKPQTVAFVLDYFSENSRLETFYTLNNALAVKGKLGSEVYIFCKNLKVDSVGMETLYREARNQGVVFLKFQEEPKIESCEDGRVKIELNDILLGDEVTLFCDLLVFGEKALPSFEAETLSSMLKVGTDSQGFYQDENVHLYPVSSRRKGIFFAGSCRGDLDLAQTWMDVSSVAMDVYELLSRGRVKVDLEKVKAEPDKCATCLTCVRVCPHNAIRLALWNAECGMRNAELKEVSLHSEIRIPKSEIRTVAQIYDLACDGCGICAAICPAKAIEFSGFSDGQILAEIEAMGKDRIVAFCCAESAYRAADKAGKLGIYYPDDVRVISVPCVGRVDVLHILKAFEQGATEVLVMGCQEGACQHLEGNIRAKERVKYAQSLLKEIGMDGKRIKMVNIGPDMAWRFAQEVTNTDLGLQSPLPKGVRGLSVLRDA
jgi:heterodisulfide reductase subunit A